MRFTRTSVAALIVVLALLPAAALAKQIITQSGSTSIFPLATALAKAYIKQFPGKTGFRIIQGGSDIGINDVSRGRVTIGDASRDPLPSDPGGLTFNKIARDGICVITNPGNAINTLSQDQVKAIFTGQTRDWSAVPGAQVPGAIDLITRTAASGTADAFQNIFLGQDLKIAASAAAKDSNGLVAQAVRSDKNAIGFVSFDFISGTHAVGYQGVPCTLRNAKSGQYQGVRNFWLVTRGPATGAAATYISWIQHNSKAKAIIATHWITLR